MSTLPTPEQPDNAIINRSDLQPIDSSDPPGIWGKFKDGIRRHIGLKPLYLAEQAAAGKVRKLHADAGSVEAEAQAKLLDAQGDFAVKMANVRQIEEETRSTAIENNRKEVQNDFLTESLRRSKGMSPREAFESLKRIADEISTQHGGYIEFQTHDGEEDGEVG